MTREIVSPGSVADYEARTGNSNGHNEALAQFANEIAAALGIRPDELHGMGPEAARDMLQEAGVAIVVSYEVGGSD